jgi:hypothetical protein
MHSCVVSMKDASMCLLSKLNTYVHVSVCVYLLPKIPNIYILRKAEHMFLSLCVFICCPKYQIYIHITESRTYVQYNPALWKYDYGKLPNRSIHVLLYLLIGSPMSQIQNFGVVGAIDPLSPSSFHLKCSTYICQWIDEIFFLSPSPPSLLSPSFEGNRNKLPLWTGEHDTMK